MKMSTRYKRITQTEFEEKLGSVAAFERVEDGESKENVYRINLPADDLEVRVYSTLERGAAREKGSDAIRTTIYDTEHDVVVGGRTKTLRLDSWFDNLRPKLIDLVSNWRDYDYATCPECTGRLVRREGSHGSFLGCSNYPACSHTRSVE